MGIYVPQARAIPHVLSGSDVVVTAPTGTGKTLSYALPLLNQVVQSSEGSTRLAWQGLVLIPTSELCEQVRRPTLAYCCHALKNPRENSGGLIASFRAVGGRCAARLMQLRACQGKMCLSPAWRPWVRVKGTRELKHGSRLHALALDTSS